jgi:ParB-like chromosome segregation protein Spo0J
VVVGREPDETYEMVNGFTRLRAVRKLGYTSLQAKFIPGNRIVPGTATLPVFTSG